MSVKNRVEPAHAHAHVNLVQSVIILGQKGCFVRGQVEGNPSKMEHLLFEPKHETLEPLGLYTQESLVIVHSDGSVMIPCRTSGNAYLARRRKRVRIYLSKCL